MEIALRWLVVNEVGHLCQGFWPAMVSQLRKEFINFVTLNVTFEVKDHSGIRPFDIHVSF